MKSYVQFNFWNIWNVDRIITIHSERNNARIETILQFCQSGEFDDYKNNVVTTPEAQTEENHHNMELLLVAIEDFKNFL